MYQNAQFATNKLDKIPLVCEEVATDLPVVTENGFFTSNIGLLQLPNSSKEEHLPV